jgi:hypothetical protein
MIRLKIKDKQQCRWDFIGLGEVMLRLDPGDKSKGGEGGILLPPLPASTDEHYTFAIIPCV